MNRPGATFSGPRVSRWGGRPGKAAETLGSGTKKGLEMALFDAVFGRFSPCFKPVLKTLVGGARHEGLDLVQIEGLLSRIGGSRPPAASAATWISRPRCRCLSGRAGTGLPKIGPSISGRCRARCGCERSPGTGAGPAFGADRRFSGRNRARSGAAVGSTPRIRPIRSLNLPIAWAAQKQLLGIT
jgi:hypothetical protein